MNQTARSSKHTFKKESLIAVIAFLIAFLSFYSGPIKLHAYKMLLNDLRDMPRPPHPPVDRIRVDNAVSMPNAAKNDAIVVTIARDGTLYLGQDRTAIDHIAFQIHDSPGNQSNRNIYLNVDSRARTRDVEDLMDSMRSVGVSNIGLLANKNDKVVKEPSYCDFHDTYDIYGDNSNTYPTVSQLYCLLKIIIDRRSEGILSPKQIPKGMEVQLFSKPEEQKYIPARIPDKIWMPLAAGEQPPSADAANVVVRINRVPSRDPMYKINATDVFLDELRQRLTEIYAYRSERVLFIMGDDDLNFKEVATVIDAARSVNVDHVGLLTPGIRARR